MVSDTAPPPRDPPAPSISESMIKRSDLHFDYTFEKGDWAGKTVYRVNRPHAKQPDLLYVYKDEQGTKNNELYIFIKNSDDGLYDPSDDTIEMFPKLKNVRIVMY